MLSKNQKTCRASLQAGKADTKPPYAGQKAYISSTPVVRPFTVVW